MDAAESTAAAAQPRAHDAASDRPNGLSDRELEVLEFEQQWWKYAGAKEHAVRERFGMSSTRYYQVLNRLIEKPEAMRADPMLVKRLRKTRAARARTRAARKLGIELP